MFSHLSQLNFSTARIVFLKHTTDCVTALLKVFIFDKLKQSKAKQHNSELLVESESTLSELLPASPSSSFISVYWCHIGLAPLLLQRYLRLARPFFLCANIEFLLMVEDLPSAIMFHQGFLPQSPWSLVWHPRTHHIHLVNPALTYWGLGARLPPSVSSSCFLVQIVWLFPGHSKESSLSSLKKRTISCQTSSPQLE